MGGKTKNLNSLSSGPRTHNIALARVTTKRLLQWMKCIKVDALCPIAIEQQHTQLSQHLHDVVVRGTGGDKLDVKRIHQLANLSRISNHYQMIEQFHYVHSSA